MEWSKIKNIVLLILVVTNLVLLFFVGQRQLHDRSQQEQARADAVDFLRENGITVADETLPRAAAPLPMQAERDLDAEKSLSSKLLGEGLTAQDRGGGVYRYSNGRGALQFHSDGAFLGEFSADSFPLDGETPARHALALLETLGFVGETVEEGDGFVIVCQLSDGAPVFNLQVTAHYENGALTALSAGRRLFGVPTVRADAAPISVPAALVDFFTGLTALGDVCSSINSVREGYVSSVSLTGAMTLTPVWHITTDTGVYQLDLLSGALSRT